MLGKINPYPKPELKTATALSGYEHKLTQDLEGGKSYRIPRLMLESLFLDDGMLPLMVMVCYP